MNDRQQMDTDFDANAPISEVRLMTPAELQAASDEYQRDAIAGSQSPPDAGYEVDAAGAYTGKTP